VNTALSNDGETVFRASAAARKLAVVFDLVTPEVTNTKLRLLEAQCL
jgi:hypothetical protein